jgi:hypothetical protein
MHTVRTTTRDPGTRTWLRRTLAVAACLVVAALALPAGANDASFEGDGATVFAVKETRVRMAHERVQVRWTAQPGEEARAPWLTDALYTFENLTDADVTLQMGHPDWRTHGDGRGRRWALRDFAVEVDGKPVEAVHKEVLTPEDRPKLLDERFRAAWVWDVTIPAGGRLQVRNTYRMGGLRANGPFEVCAAIGDGDELPPAAKKAHFIAAKPRRGGTDLRNGLCSTVTYVVTSGRTWAGPIGEAEFEFDLRPGTPAYMVVPVPAAHEVAGGKIRWRFEDWTPDGELSVHYTFPLDQDGPVLPAIETPAEARAWRAFAVANGMDTATLEYARDFTAAVLAGQHDAPVLAEFLRLHGVFRESAAGPRLPAAQARKVLEIMGKGLAGKGLAGKGGAGKGGAGQPKP